MRADPTVDLLTTLHQGSHMAVQGFDEAIKDAADPALKRHFSELQDLHKQVALEASMKLKAHGQIPEEPHTLTQLAAWAQHEAQTLLDRSPDHLVSLMLGGARMGLQALEESIDRDFAADPEALSMAIAYRDRQREQLERLRQIRRQIH